MWDALPKADEVALQYKQLSMVEQWLRSCVLLVPDVGAASETPGP